MFDIKLVEKDVKSIIEAEAFYAACRLALIGVNFMRSVVYDKHNI